MKISIFFIYSILGFFTSCLVPLDWCQNISFAQSTIRKRTIPLHGLIPVSSTYTDDGTQEKTSIQGSLLLFTYHDEENNSQRLFGITSSHVSQGQHSLKFSGTSILTYQLLGRLANNENDLELFEFPIHYVSDGIITPLGHWNKKIKQIVVSKKSIDQWINDDEKKARSLVYFEKSKNSTFEYFTLKGDWVQKEMNPSTQTPLLSSELVYGNSTENKVKLLYIPTENEIYSRTQIIPGMSGSPLLSNTNSKSSSILFNAMVSNQLLNGLLEFSETNEPSSVYVLGLAKNYDRYLSGSWFTTETSISNLLFSYLDGKRQWINPTRWKLRYGITYRDFGDGSAEIYPFAENRNRSPYVSKGEAARGEAGGPGRGDGGGPGRGDGGGPGRGDGGDNDHQKSLNETFQNILPGVMFEHEHILGFHLFQNVGFYIEGNPRKALDYLTDGQQPSNSTIKVNSDFHQLFLNKLQASWQLKIELNNEKIQALSENKEIYDIKLEYFTFQQIFKQCQEDKSSCSIKPYEDIEKLGKMSYDEYVENKLSFFKFKRDNTYPSWMKQLNKINSLKASQSIIVQSEMKKSALDINKLKLEIHKDRIDIQLVSPAPLNELIQFSLDRYGRQLQNKQPLTTYFSPYIRVTTKSNHWYYIDLRSLYFISTLYLHDPLETPGIIESPEKPKISTYALQRLLSEGPTIRFGSSDSSQIYEVSFNKINITDHD